MKCDELDLLAFRDRQVTEGDQRRVKAHLEACRQCRDELEALDQTIELLTRHWTAGEETCPAPDVLEAFRQGSIQAVQREALQRHLHRCESCSTLLRLIERFEEDAQLDLADELQEPLPGPIAEALQGLRRESLARRLRKTFETVVKQGKDELSKTPSLITQMVDDLLSPSPREAPGLAIPKDAAEVEPEQERRDDKKEKSGDP